jgi:hypothetical protein
MSWVYLDDNFADHPKAIQARSIHKDAPWLYVAGLCWVKRMATGGVIPSDQVPRLISQYQPKAAKALVEVGLWEQSKDGYLIHDYDEWNIAKESRSASGRNAAQTRWLKESLARQKDTNVTPIEGRTND